MGKIYWKKRVKLVSMSNRVQLLEYTYSQGIRKQRSITSLFPTFRDRVKAVVRKGKPKLIGIEGDVFYFEVPSGTEEGKKYEVKVGFVDVEDTLRNIIRFTREIYNKNGTVNYLFLTDVFIDKVDIQWGCSCPADLYWGQRYIRTQRDASTPPPENRAPRKRNRKEYGFVCKHGQTVLERLVYYVTTISKWLKKNYGVFIEEEVNKLNKERTFFSAAGSYLRSLEKAQQNAKIL